MKDQSNAFLNCYKTNKQFEPDESCWVSASAIRDCLIKPSSTPHGPLSVCLRGRPATGDHPGVTIYIVGTLDLRDASGAEGGPLPPLVATHCKFVEPWKGARPADFETLKLALIEIARSHQSRITLRGSHFARLRANNCVIDGDCDVSSEFVDALRQAATCQVRLDGAAIGGSLHVSGRAFEELRDEALASEKRSISPPYYRNCALDLGNATIGRDVIAVGSTFRGLLNGRGIVVGGSVRLMAIHALRPTGYAAHRSGKSIDLQYARVEGNISCRASQNPAAPNEIEGTIFLNAARVGGEVIIQGGRFLGNPVGADTGLDEKRTTAIDLQCTNVGGNLRIGADEDDEQTAEICGSILLDYAVVSGNLAIRKIMPMCDAGSTRPRMCFLRAIGITVQQQFSISDSVLVADPRRTGIRYCAADFWRSTILLGVKIDRRTKIDGSVRFNNSTLSRSVVLRGTFDSARKSDNDEDAIDTRLDLSNSTIDGDLRINDRLDGTQPTICIDGAVTLDRTVVTGLTVLENIVFRYPAIRPRIYNSAYTVAEDRNARERARLGHNRRLILNLKNFAARGGLTIRNISWDAVGSDRCAVTVPTPPAKPSEPGWLRKWIDGHLIVRDSIFHDDLAIIDARGMRCAFLNDGHGAEWGLHFGHLLRLDQIAPERIEEDEGHHRDGEKRTVRLDKNGRFLPPSDKAIRRLMFLAHQATRIVIFHRKGHVWFIWWRMRFFGPQPYDAFARAYINRGDLLVGRDILIRKTDIESWRKSHDIALSIDSSRWKAFASPNKTIGGAVRSVLTFPILVVTTLIAAIVQTFLSAYRWMFGYGLQWDRALVSFVFCIAFGVFGTHYAKTGHPFSLAPAKLENGKPAAQVALVKTIEEKGALNVLTRDAAISIDQHDQLCDVDSISFAVDAFIPLLDMNFAQQCQIRSDPPADDARDIYAGWRIGLLMYELLGWLVVSLTILTISGIIRRDVDK